MSASEVDTARSETSAPQVFAKSLQAPPGLPWDQQAAAKLEAQHAAPLPIAKLAVRVQRTEPWRPGKAGAFAALYVRQADISGELAASAELDGRVVRARFQSREHAATRKRSLVGSMLVSAVAAVLVTGSTASAIFERHARERDLGRLERLASRQLALASADAALKRQDLALSKVTGERGSVEEVLRAIGSVSQARIDGTPIEAFHWRAEGVAVEVRGDGQPFRAGAGKKVDEPLRPGVWLWVLSDGRRR